MKKPAGRGKLRKAYAILLKTLGPQHWWPAETDFEVVVGAILTQSTSWGNVEKAVANLKEAGVLSPKGLRLVRVDRLSRLVRPSLYHNTKARKLKAFTGFLYGEYGGRLGLMRREGLETLRPRLLSVWGVGPETADSILLYALGKPSFVVDAYTVRVFSRLGLIRGDEGYERVRAFFQGNLDADVGLFREYHALIVEAGKRFCRKNMPLCGECPLGVMCVHAGRVV